MKTTIKPRQRKSRKQLCNKNHKTVELCYTHDKVKQMADRLDILRTKCEQEIRETEDKLRVLKAKLANLNTLAQESEKLANPQAEPDKYADTGLTAAVADAVTVLWRARGGGATATEIKNFLLARGFQAPDNFDTAIYTVLNRLIESERIEVAFQAQVINAGGIRVPTRKSYKPK